MKKLALALAAITTLGMAAPSDAEAWGYRYGGYYPASYGYSYPAYGYGYAPPPEVVVVRRRVVAPAYYGGYYPASYGYGYGGYYGGYGVSQVGSYGGRPRVVHYGAYGVHRVGLYGPWR